jgi:hypothetical protein
MNRSTRTFSALAAVGAMAIVPVSSLSTIPSAGAVTVPTCSSTALTVTLGPKGQEAMSSAGFAIAVTNDGRATCSLDGFATVIALTRTSSTKPITFAHSTQSQDYLTASPKIVFLGPKGTASFGISYTDNKDQQYGRATGCQMYAVNVRLPGAKPSSTTRLLLASIAEPAENYVNACFTNFKFGLTPLVAGSVPPNP